VEENYDAWLCCRTGRGGQRAKETSPSSYATGTVGLCWVWMARRSLGARPGVRSASAGRGGAQAAVIGVHCGSCRVRAAVSSVQAPGPLVLLTTAVPLARSAGPFAAFPALAVLPFAVVVVVVPLAFAILKIPLALAPPLALALTLPLVVIVVVLRRRSVSGSPWGPGAATILIRRGVLTRLISSGEPIHSLAVGVPNSAPIVPVGVL